MTSLISKLFARKRNSCRNEIKEEQPEIKRETEPKGTNLQRPYKFNASLLEDLFEGVDVFSKLGTREVRLEKVKEQRLPYVTIRNQFEYDSYYRPASGPLPVSTRDFNFDSMCSNLRELGQKIRSLIYFEYGPNIRVIKPNEDKSLFLVFLGGD